jgi:hypothetical protein
VHLVHQKASEKKRQRRGEKRRRAAAAASGAAARQKKKKLPHIRHMALALNGASSGSSSHARAGVAYVIACIINGSASVWFQMDGERRLVLV